MLSSSACSPIRPIKNALRLNHMRKLMSQIRRSLTSERLIRITPKRMVEVLGPAPKPATVWQRQFDGCNYVLAEIAKMNWDEIPDKYLISYYFYDMGYMSSYELQRDLFRHVFPACLK